VAGHHSSAERDPASEIATWRRVVIDRSLWLALGVLTAAGTIGLLQGKPGSVELILRLLPGLAVVGVALTWRSAPIPLRGSGLIAGFLIAVVGVGLDRGYSVPNPFVGGIFLCILAALVLDRRGAWMTVIVATLLWVPISYLFLIGRELPTDVVASHTEPSSWVRIITIFAVIASAATSAVLFMVTRLERALYQAESLHQALQAQTEERLTAVKEQHRLEAQLQQAQRLDSLGRLTGGIAHDFNNLLLVILGNAEFYADEDLPREQARKSASEIVAAAERAATLTQQLLAFGRHQAQEATRLDVACSVEKTLGLIRRLFPSSIHLALDLACELPAAWGPPTAIEQILMNLAINSRDSMPEGGRLAVQTSGVLRAPSGDEGAGEKKLYSRIRVMDNGSGMSAETRERAFDPFFTTKPVGMGSGLGLSLVLGLAEQCGGFVELFSEPGKGTTIDVYLAESTEDQEATSEVVEVSENWAGHGETLLVVDDDAQVRGVISGMLVRAGYSVIEAANGEEALSLFRQRGQEVALVVSDAVMPQMGGRALYEEIRRLRPSIPFLVCSGYASNLFSEDFFRNPRRAFLRKPFRPTQLARAVSNLLREGTGDGIA